MPLLFHYQVHGKPGGDKLIEITRDQDLVWSVTIPLLDPDLYYYVFNVDGINVCDPANPSLNRDGATYRNIFIVDGDYAADFKDAATAVRGDVDPWLAEAQEFDQLLTAHGMQHTFYVTGGGHEWKNWRHYLDTFTPLLFK